jgi:thiol:disulfide interchange protein DsbD
MLRGDRAPARHGVLLLIPLVCLLTMAGKASAAAGPHGTVDLISDETSIQPGRAFWAGLRFQLEKGWHIYWINPGDSGEPPKIQWTLPAGFHAGPLHWPTPRRIQDHSLVDYGYQDEVLLSAQIQPPASLGTAQEVQLRATVKWLVCREICLPARADLNLTLPVAKGARGEPSAWHSLFAQTRAGLPRPAPNSWRLFMTLEGQRFLLNVDTGKPGTAAIFFPSEPNQVENAAPQKVNSSSRGFQLELQKSNLLLKPVQRLAGLLVLASGQGYVIQAPVAVSNSERTH